MKYLLLPLTLLTGVFLYSTAQFVAVVGGPALDLGVYVSPMPDGGYVAVGVTSSFGAGNEDVYLIRTDPAGQTLWTQTFGGPQTDNGWAVHEQAGLLFITGFTDSFGAGGFDCYLLAVDLEGTQQWSNTFGGEGKDRCWGFLPLGNGGFVLVGETTSSGSGAEDCYLVKTDASGNHVWSKTFGGAMGDRCFAIAQADDGGFMLAGQTYSMGAGDRDAYVIKTDTAGNEVWAKTFGGAVSDVAHGIAPTDDGTFFVTGYTTSLAADEDDPFLIKIDAEGEVLWTRVLPMKGVNHTITGEQTTDGGYILGGFSAFTSSGARGALLVKTDSAGNLQWFRDILPTATGRSSGYTVRATSDGGAVLTGHTTEGSAGDLDLLLVKVDPQGEW